MNDITVPEQYDLQTASLKVPPHSIEAEQSVLGGLMLEPVGNLGDLRVRCLVGLIEVGFQRGDLFVELGDGLLHRLVLLDGRDLGLGGRGNSATGQRADHGAERGGEGHRCGEHAVTLVPRPYGEARPIPRRKLGGLARCRRDCRFGRRRFRHDRLGRGRGCRGDFGGRRQRRRCDGWQFAIYRFRRGRANHICRRIVLGDFGRFALRHGRSSRLVVHQSLTTFGYQSVTDRAPPLCRQGPNPGGSHRNSKNRRISWER